MKKKLIIVLYVLLATNIIPSKIFAQGDPGGGPVDPPSFILNCKKNNGNGTSGGGAEVRLSFSDKNFHDIILLEIRNIDGSPLPEEAIIDGIGNFEKGYMSYSLLFNIPPANKLRFHFTYSGGDFWITGT